MVTFRELAEEGEFLKQSIMAPLPEKVVSQILPVEIWARKCIKTLRQRVPQSTTIHYFTSLAATREPNMLTFDKMLFLIEGLALTEDLVSLFGETPDPLLHDVPALAEADVPVKLTLCQNS
ncbi:hypothetical protein GTO89_04945 [Heliobacterium gestii]|uniref:Uncharacterized protein n=1 Tax=Heliomicrobium gestii TaxID=2699 RepID=A0A845L841_HELGE|nr:hypothetical protein [Heliomicrobium gestii]MBM7866965.1 hypothetical protein [Heliomicrobium gestii]MZP42388.1 hypothetical protein [Heliomicrobium gestii]